MPSYLVELEGGKKYQVEAESPPTEEDIQQYLGGQAPPEKSKPLVDISDTLSGAAHALSGLPTTVPHAYHQLSEGLKNPWQRSESYKTSAEAMRKYQEETEAAEKAAEESGDASWLGSGMRQAGQSLGFSGGAMGASLVGGSTAGTAGRYLGGLASPAGAVAGEVAGRTLGALGASYGAAYRMAGAQFLDDARDELEAKFQQHLGRPMTEQEQAEAYAELKPLAEKFGHAEAGPEAIGNLALGLGGRYVLGLGRKKLVQLANQSLLKTGVKKLAAGIGAEAVELGGETATQVEQKRLEAEKQAILRGEDPNSVAHPDRSMAEYGTALGEIAPATVAQSLLGLGAGTAYKGIKSAVTPAGAVPVPAAPTDGTPAPVNIQTPVVSNGQTIAYIPQGSDLTPDDVAEFADDPETLKKMAREGKITLPEIVTPVPGVNPAITQEMNANVAAGAALAPGTVEALQASQAATAEVSTEPGEFTPAPIKDPGEVDNPINEPKGQQVSPVTTETETPIVPAQGETSTAEIQPTQDHAAGTKNIEEGVRAEPAPGDQSREVESPESRDSVLRAEEERAQEVAPKTFRRLTTEETKGLQDMALHRFNVDPEILQRIRDKLGFDISPDQAAAVAVEFVQQARERGEMALIGDALADQPEWAYRDAWKALNPPANINVWAPQINEPAAANINGHTVVGTVGAPLPGGKTNFHYNWNGKPQTATVPVSQLSRPVTALSEAPRYIYTQEQNSRKAGKHIPVTPGVHENFNFRQAFASMAEDKSLSRIYQEIARILSKMPQFTNMDLHIVADGRRPYAGEYTHTNGRSAIAINLRQVARGKVDALGTLLHEALHHVTLAKVRDPQGDVELDAAHALNSIRLKLAKVAGAERFGYELGSNEEFITGVFTHPGFQDFLASLPEDFSPGSHAGKFRSLLSEIFRRIAELVTGKHVAKGSTLEQSMASILALFETPHRVLDLGPLQKLGPVQSRAEGYRSPADLLAETAAKMRGEKSEKPAGLNSMFNPKPGRPATGERTLFETPKKPAINLTTAYQKAQTGRSTAWVPIKDVYEQAKASDPSLTPEAFMAHINEQNDTGGIMVSPVEQVSTVEAARPFVVGAAGVEMLVPEMTPKSEAESNVTPEQDAEYMQAVKDGDVAKQQAMVDAAAKAAGYDKLLHHGTPESTYTPGEWVGGDASNRSKLEEMASRFGINGFDAVASVLERWKESGILSKKGATDEDVANARTWQNQAKSGYQSRGTHALNFNEFEMPSGEQELGTHLGTVEQALNFGEYAHPFFVKLGREVRLADLGTWDYQAVMMALRKKGVKISDAEYEAVYNANDNNQALRELLISKSVNSIVYKNEAEARGDSYIVFNPNQIKSADPITRDADGNVIPLSQRFNPESNSTLYSLAEEQGPPGVTDIGGEAEPADGKGTQLHQKEPTAIGSTYTTPADITLQEKRTQEETLAKARTIIGESIKADGPIKGRRAALDRFRLDTSIPPEVRAAGTGMIAQQSDIMANLETGPQQLLLDEMTDEAAKLSGVIASDPDSFQNLKADANLNIDKMAEEAGRTLNIFNVFRRLTPEGFLRRMTRKYNDTVREKVGQNFDVPVEKVESEIALLRRMARESTSPERRKAILAAIKAYKQHDIDAKKLIEALFPQAGFRARMNKGGESLVRDFFQMMAGPRDGKGPLAEFDETIQGALSSMLRKVMEAQGLVAKNASNQMTDIDKMVRAVSGDELRFDKIAAADDAMQQELAKIQDPERRTTLQQAWEEATSKMFTNIASDATVRRAINAELKSANVDWTKMFDTNQQPTAIRGRVVDAVMGKIEALLTDPTDPTVKRNLSMLRDEVSKAFDFISDVKHNQWLAQREAVEARRRVAEHRAAFMAALRNQGVAEQTINRISEKLAGPQRGKPDQNPVSALVGEHMKEEVPDFVDKMVALDVDRATAEKLDKAASTLRTEIAAAEKLKAADRAVAALMKSLKPKPRAPREKIEKSLKTLFTADAVGALDDQAFFDAFGEAFGMPPLNGEQQTKIKKLIREINSLPKGPARLDKQQDLDEELALWKGIAARDVLLSAWYANILSGVSTQGMGMLGNLLNFVPRSLFNAIANPRSAGAYFKGAFGEGLATGIEEAKAALKGRGLYKVSKYGDKNLVSALELLRKKGPSTLPEWVAYIASGGTRLRYVFRIMQAIDALAWNTAREGHAYLAAHRALLAQEKESGQKRSPEEFYKAFIDSLGGDTAQIEEDLRAARQTLIDAGQTPALLTVDRMARDARNARRAAGGVKAGNRFADRIVLQQEPEGSGRFISSLIDVFQKKGNILGLPVGQMLIPFNKIVSNLFEQSLDYTPVGALRAYLGGHLSDVKGINSKGHAEFKEGAQLFDQMERRERAMAATAGMAASAIIYALAHAYKDEPDEDVPFMVYGWGPESKNKRSQMPKGWVPYSIKMGDHYVKFSEMPFGMMLAAAGTAMDAMRYKNMDKKTSSERLAYVLKASAKGFMNQGVMSSLDTAMETMMFQASDKKIADIPVNAVKGFVPAQGLLRDISTIFDPSKVSNESLTSALLRDIPFAKGLATKPDLNVFGEPIKMDGYPIIRRIVTHREPHAVADYLGRNDLHIPGMEQTIEIGKYLPKAAHDRIQSRALELGAMENGLFTPEQNYEFKKRAGELTKAAVQDIMREIPKVTDDKQRKHVQSVIDKRVENARKRAMLEAVPLK